MSRNARIFLQISVHFYYKSFYYGEFAIIKSQAGLICLANLENLNSVFIKEGLEQSERLEKFKKIAISQMQILNDTDVKYLN